MDQPQVSIETHGPTTQSSVSRHLDQSELSIETAQQSIKTSDQPEHRIETSDQSEQSIDSTVVLLDTADQSEHSIHLDQHPVLVIHVAERLAQHLEPLLRSFLLLQPPLLEVIVRRPLAAVHQEPLQLPQPANV